MTEQTEREAGTCPACGKGLTSDAKCCEFAIAEKSEKMPAIAEVVKPDGHRLPISTRWLRIGREHDNDIVIADDSYASRYHAWITFEQDHFWVEDLGSTNGTMLNGQSLQRRELLASGDKIKIGESEMTFVLLEKTGATS